MFKRILVTLDGSDISERALEPAFLIAQRCEAQVVLLRVLSLEAVAVAAGNGPEYVEISQMHEKHDREEADNYLRGIKAQWMATGVPISAQVAVGAPPEKILAAADDVDADLIVMSTHGRSGLSRFLYGSVAEAVLRGTHLPVLMIPTK
jgi:nucleotide-binding universal stress UspA family protein